jgi:hypothetical protein
MSIKAMTWAFGLPLEPRAKLALLAIADNARDDGIAWPSRDTIAEKSSQSRSTVNRRVKTLVELGIIRLTERFREDGTRTTDEIHLDLSVSPDDVLRKLHDSGQPNEAETDDETISDGSETDGPQDLRTPCQADTLPVQSGHPTGAVLTGGGWQSGHGQDEPSLEQETPPTPSGGPLSKSDREASEARDKLWHRFVVEYPGIGAMDQQAARAEFNSLALLDAEWAVSVLPALKAELKKAGDRAPKNAHIWLRKGMFENFPRQKLDAPPPEGVWIVEGSDEDRALRLVRSLARAVSPFVQTRGGDRGYLHKTPVGADMLAMLAARDSPLRWPAFQQGTAEFAAWQSRFTQWIGVALPLDHHLDAIRAPWQWPPAKDGRIYSDEPPVDGQSTAS